MIIFIGIGALLRNETPMPPANGNNAFPSSTSLLSAADHRRAIYLHIRNDKDGGRDYRHDDDITGVFFSADFFISAVIRAASLFSTASTSEGMRAISPPAPARGAGIAVQLRIQLVIGGAPMQVNSRQEKATGTETA
ncbi:hypothetical protein M8494_01315 [Serratia ureilytica]